MSFRQLPPETQQHIVDLCYHADQGYSNLGIAGGGVGDKKWWGRSCFAISLVNKDLRAMAIKHLFSTARATNMAMGNMTFSTFILPTPLVEAITEVRFDDYASPETLRFCVQHVLPRLPRLDTITGLDRNVIKAVFRPEGIHTTSGGMRSLSKMTLNNVWGTDYEGFCCWRVFNSIARRIKHWEIGLEEEEVEALFSIDPSIKQNIKSLSLISRGNGDFPILESDSSQFPALLSSLPSLTSLAISPGYFSESDDASSVSRNALSTSYEFASTLTSFTWTGDEDADETENVVDISLLRLLARFTSLRSLKINAFNFNIAVIPADEPKVLFPRLVELDLACEEILMLDRILEVMDLPKLEVLRLSFNSPGRDREFLLEAAGRKGSETEASYKFHTDWQPGFPEMAASAAGYGSALKKGEIIEGLVNGIEDMSAWIKHEVEGIKFSEDIPKARALVKAMGPLHELRKWSEV
ncbi:uncharacterized protein JCM6883_006561 [Sporobolomyces salmoneus]|uniref:uncharacterized protein n=1 Tax=Sporobolomyces salmoneus TaxID=183962 RepID=UPI00317BCF90